MYIGQALLSSSMSSSLPVPVGTVVKSIVLVSGLISLTLAVCGFSAVPVTGGSARPTSGAAAVIASLTRAFSDFPII